MILSRNSEKVVPAEGRWRGGAEVPDRGIAVHYKHSSTRAQDIVQSGNYALSSPAAMKAERVHGHDHEMTALGVSGFYDHLARDKFSKHYHFKWSRCLGPDEGMELCKARLSENGKILFPGRHRGRTCPDC